MNSVAALSGILREFTGGVSRSKISISYPTQVAAAEMAKIATITLVFALPFFLSLLPFFEYSTRANFKFIRLPLGENFFTSTFACKFRRIIQ